MWNCVKLEFVNASQVHDAASLSAISRGNRTWNVIESVRTLSKVGQGNRKSLLLLDCWLHASTNSSRQQAVAPPLSKPKDAIQTIVFAASILFNASHSHLFQSLPNLYHVASLMQNAVQDIRRVEKIRIQAS